MKWLSLLLMGLGAYLIVGQYGANTAISVANQGGQLANTAKNSFLLWLVNPILGFLGSQTPDAEPIQPSYTGYWLGGGLIALGLWLHKKHS